MKLAKEPERRRGRPGVKGGGTLIGVRVSPEFLARIDQWRAGRDLSRPQAIIQLAELALGRRKAT